MTTGSDDKQLVNTLVTVVNTLSIPLLQRDRTLPVTSDEKKRVFFLGDYKCKIGIGKHRLTTFAKHYSKKHISLLQSMIEIRKTEIAELGILMELFEQGKRIMRKSGNLKQWTGGYPDEELVKKDIENGNSYVCLDEERNIVGTFTFIQGNDPTYARIYEGAWSDDTRPYGVIHRLASTEQSKGVASACLQWCYRQIPNLRADTHRDNHILQHILKKHGFQYCGIIYLLNGDERLAFQKL